MAYVSISKDLIQDVEHKIRMMKDRQVNELVKPDSAMVVAVDDPMVTELIWGEHLHLAAVIPNKWCKQMNTITLKTTFVEDGVAKFNATFNLIAKNAQFRVPAASSDNYSSVITIEVLPTHPLLLALIAYTQQVRDINAHWRKIGNDVVVFLRSAKSLNEALKLWPALELYIPESYVKKVAEKKAKAASVVSKAQEVLAGIDTDNITASAVASRMSTI